MKTPTFLLAIDDRPENLFVLEELVDQHLPECALVTANNAEEGLALAAKRSFDGVLIDVQMPGIDGIEMCRRLKADETNGHLPILLVTAHGSTAELRIRGLEAGADDFISRPIDNFELVAKIRVMLRIKRAEDELRAVNAHLEELVAERTRALQEKARLNQILLDSMPCMALLLRPQTREIVASNEMAVKVGAIPGKRCFATWGQRDDPCPWCRAPKLWATGEAQQLEVGALDAVWDAHWIPVSDDLYLYYAFDVTQRKRDAEELSRAKKAADAANRAKSAFLANMSHEIRTPMTSILGYADLLMSYDWSPGERREHLQTIHRQGHNLLTIINDVLDLAKIEAGNVELEPMDCSPSEVMEEVRSLLQVRATEKNVELEITCSHPLPKTICTDPVRLRQILVNLVGNAIKFTQRGGVKIRVRCTQPEDAPAKMQFEITDTGIGMSEEEISRLFRPFTQADMSYTRRYGGTGLGLHISQRLAKMLGGQIEVQSEPGVGSTFTLTIDPDLLQNVELKTPARTLPKEEKPAQAGQKQRLRGRILLAEDVKDVRTLVRMNLEAIGLEVDSAENGQIAIEKASTSTAQGRPYDLILMDIQMPELDGYTATQRLRRDGWKGPIIALTAHAMTGDREKCLEAGCDDYISKPMTDAELFSTIARHLDKATSGLSAGAPGI